MERIIVVSVLVVMLFCITRQSHSATLTYKVKGITEDNLVELTNGKKVKIVGIKIIADKKEPSREFIKRLAESHRLIIIDNSGRSINVMSSDIVSAHVFVFGNPKAIELARNSEGITRGFLDVRNGLFGVSKVLAVNIGGLLIKEGYAEVDLKGEFIYKDIFMKIHRQELLN